MTIIRYDPHMCQVLCHASFQLSYFHTLSNPTPDCYLKVVQEYERAVIFRLGRLVTGGARGPGVFFVIPCLDVYEKIDMRTSTYDVPPQEVTIG